MQISTLETAIEHIFCSVKDLTTPQTCCRVRDRSRYEGRLVRTQQPRDAGANPVILFTRLGTSLVQGLKPQSRPSQPVTLAPSVANWVNCGRKNPGSIPGVPTLQLKPLPTRHSVGTAGGRKRSEVGSGSIWNPDGAVTASITNKVAPLGFGHTYKKVGESSGSSIRNPDEATPDPAIRPASLGALGDEVGSGFLRIGEFDGN